MTTASTALETRLTIAGVVLEARLWPGGGTPLLLLHEALGSVAMWRDFPDRLAHATGHPVIAWSRQGYGQSDALPRAWDPDYMHREAALVAPVMDALRLERAVLFGHSDGGSIALLAAAARPDRVAGLILEAPHVYVEQLTVHGIAAVAEVYRPTDLGARLARYHRDPDATFWRWNDIWLDPRFRDWNIEQALAGIDVPTLLIQGRDDEYGTLDQLDRIATLLPRTTRLELDRCGHSPHRDQPDAVIAASNVFLGEIE
jgi:pimeloyl-ACP methyl ester carboxylesterase